MLNIFRKVRWSFISKNKISGYLLYAVGEVLLVMIGILLALQVNNWNEQRKETKELNNILRIISYDMETDTLVANVILKIYEEKNKNSLKIINNELDRNNFTECRECIALVTLYKPLNIQTKGFELLKKISNYETTQKDSLITDITQIYTLFKANIDKSNDRLENDVLNNLESFKEYPWFVDWTEGKFNQDMIIYFTESENYRIKVASHNLLAAGNHTQIIKLYKQNLIVILDRIKKRLGAVE